MANDKISKDPVVVNRVINIVPMQNVEYHQYMHEDIQPKHLKYLNLPGSTLSKTQIDLLALMLKDMPIKEMPSYLKKFNTRNIYDAFQEIREMFGVQTNHGLIAKVYRMGLEAHLNDIDDESDE